MRMSAFACSTSLCRNRRLTYKTKRIRRKLMTTRATNLTRNVRLAVSIGLAILGLAFLTTPANAGCYDHGRGASPVLPSGLIATIAASPGAANGTIVGLWHVTYTTSDNQVFQESFDMWHTDGTELEIA